MDIRFVECLCHDKVGLRAAYTASQTLIANKWHDWPAPSWDAPAVLAFVGEDCVAGVNWSLEDKMAKANVDFAFCDSAHPKALAACLIGFRRKVAETKVVEITFGCHPENTPMLKLVDKLKLKPNMLSFRMPANSIVRAA